MPPKIIVHCLVKNEENFIWYSLNSVLPYVDKILVYDTGSTDKTNEIIKTIKSNKIVLRQIGNVDELTFSSIRQKMLDVTDKDKYYWLMILDGDEIWPNHSLAAVINFIKNNTKYESIVVRTYNLVGDIYHRLPESAGRYKLAGQNGHLALRFINLRKIKNLNVQKPYGQEGYYDQSNHLIQNRDPKKIKFLDVYYHHATHLPRSSRDDQTLKRAFKKKYELGNRIPKQDIPLIFFSPKPSIVPRVTNHATLSFIIPAILLTIPRRIKRFLINSKTGY